MTFEKALEAMRQGKKVRRMSWNDGNYICFNSAGDIVDENGRLFMLLEIAKSGDWVIYEEPQEEPEMTAEKATAILESIRCSEWAYLIQHFEKAIDFAISAIKDNEICKEVNDVLSKSLEKKNECLCECADKTEAFKHGTYFRALE